MDTRTLEHMVTVEACRALVMRSAQYADAADYAGYAALFATDGVLVRPGGAPLLGRPAIEAAYASRPAERLTRHLVTNTLVDVESPDRARGVSTVLLWSGKHTDLPGPFGRPADARQVVGEFMDEFVRTPEGWRISRRTASFVLYRDGAD
jgi:ketosteroid isomerase-like protein